MQDILDLVWASDENYVFLAGVSMTSAFENNTDYERIRVWFLADGLSQNSYKSLENCAKNYGREIYFLEVDNFRILLILVQEPGEKRLHILHILGCI